MAAVDWFAHAEVAEPAPVRRPRKPAARPARPVRSRRRHARRHVRAHILGMSLFATLLAGVVAVNVAVLRANVAVNKLDKEQVDLQAQNAALASQVSSSIASIRIEQTARHFGLVPASATDTSYLDLNRK